MATAADLQKATDASARVIISGDADAKGKPVPGGGTHPHNLVNIDQKLAQVLAILSKMSPTAAGAIDTDDLAAAIADGLSDDVAAKVADLLAARLAK